MNKLIIFISAVLFSLEIAAQNYSGSVAFSAQESVISSSSTSQTHRVTVRVRNDIEMAGLQFRFRLPDGVSLVENKFNYEESSLYAKTEGAFKDNFILSNGSYFFSVIFFNFNNQMVPVTSGTYTIGYFDVVCESNSTTNPIVEFFDCAISDSSSSLYAEPFSITLDNKDGGDEISSYINFADSNVKALCVSNWDTNNDGELSYEEAAAVTYLGEVFRSNQEITSFNELQYFTGLTNINGWAFFECTKLKSVILPEGIKSIYNNAFQQTGLISVVIPEGVTTVGNAAFCACPDLSSVSLPESLKSIGHYAFEVCGKLKTIIIPKNVSTIGNYAFRACENLRKIKMESKNPFAFGTDAFNIISSDCILFVPAGTRDAYIAAGWTEDIFKGGVVEMSSYIEFADSNVKTLCVSNWDTNNDGELSYDEAAAVTYLGEVFKSNQEITSFNELQYFTGLANINGFAFFECTKLKSVIMPEGIKSIYYNAFQQTGLISVVIPEGVTTVDNAAFYACPDLSSVSLPESLKSIGHYAFEVCGKLKTIIIPKNVSTIGNYAFRACENLRKIKMESKNPFAFGTDAFNNISSECMLVVPAGTRDAYIAAGWTEDVFKGGVGEDVSDLLDNPDFKNGFAGWKNENGGNAEGKIGGREFFPVVENYQTAVDCRQTIQTAPGAYAISVNVFERPVGNGGYDGTEETKTRLFMNQFSVPVQHIVKDAVTAESAIDGINCYLGDQSGGWPYDYNVNGYGWVPNSLDGASYAFNTGRYNQTCYGIVGEDGIMNIGLTSDGNAINWCIWGNFRLTFLGKSEDALLNVVEYYASLGADIQNAGIPDVEKLNSSIAKAQNATDADLMYATIFEIIDNYNAALESVKQYENAIAAYDKLEAAASDYAGTANADALSAAGELLEGYAEGGIKDYQYAGADLAPMILEMERATTRLKIPNYTETPCDFTQVIENPSFETGDISGWKARSASDMGARSVTDPVYMVTNADGQYVFNTWSNPAPADGFLLSQTLFAVPAGTYKLTALFASDQGNAITLSANGIEEEFIMENSKTLGQDGSVSFTLSEETDVEIKVVSPSWFKVDNFRLTLIESPIKKGDVNGDTRINGLDIVVIVDKILDRPITGTFVFAAADFDANGIINGMDLVKEVALVLSQTASGVKARKAPEKFNPDMASMMRMSKTHDGSISVGIDSAEDYILSQFVLELSDGQRLKDITATDRDHVIAFQQIDGNRYMVLCYSTRNAAFTDNNDLLRISCEGEGTVKVTDVMMVDADRKPHYVRDAEFGEATGIEIVNGSFAKPADIYSVSGALVRKNAKSIRGLGKGIYVVNGKTIIIK